MPALIKKGQNGNWGHKGAKWGHSYKRDFRLMARQKKNNHSDIASVQREAIAAVGARRIFCRAVAARAGLA